jgi:hypothetical protein
MQVSKKVGDEDRGAQLRAYIYI